MAQMILTNLTADRRPPTTNRDLSPQWRSAVCRLRSAVSRLPSVVKGTTII